MIQAKKTINEYIYEFVAGVLLNQPPADSERVLDEIFSKDAEPSVNDTNELNTLRSSLSLLRSLFRQGQLQTINGRQYPSSKSLYYTEKMKCYISPAFPNNLISPDQFKDFDKNELLIIFFFIKTQETRNGDGVVIDHAVINRYIYIENFQTVEAIETRGGGIARVARSFKEGLDNFGDNGQNPLGYPIKYFELQTFLGL